MKKLFSVFVIAAVVALVACGPGKEDVAKNNGSDSIIAANAKVIDSLKQELNDTTTYLWDSIAKLNEGKPGGKTGTGGTKPPVGAGQGKDNGGGGGKTVDPNSVKAGQGKG